MKINPRRFLVPFALRSLRFVELASRFVLVNGLVSGGLILFVLFGGAMEFIDAATTPASSAQEHWILAPADTEPPDRTIALKLPLGRPLSPQEIAKFMPASEAALSEPIEIIVDDEPPAAKQWILTRPGLDTGASREALNHPDRVVDLGLAGILTARAADFFVSGDANGDARAALRERLAQRHEGLARVDPAKPSLSPDRPIVFWALLFLTLIVFGLSSMFALTEQASLLWDGLFGFFRRGFLLAKGGAWRPAAVWGAHLFAVFALFAAVSAPAALVGRVAANLWMSVADGEAWKKGALAEFVHTPRDPRAAQSDFALGPKPEELAALRKSNPLGSDGDRLSFRADEPWPRIAARLRAGQPEAPAGALWERRGGEWKPAPNWQANFAPFFLDPWVLRLAGQTLSPRMIAQRARANGQLNPLRRLFEAFALAFAYGFMGRFLNKRREALAQRGLADTIPGSPEWEARSLAQARAAAEADLLRKELVAAARRAKEGASSGASASEPERSVPEEASPIRKARRL